jgi:hypothetical protein
MSIDIPRPILAGRKALVCGIANEHSIAYGCAKAFRELGADLAITYLNESQSYVEPVARELQAPIFTPDVRNPASSTPVRAHRAAVGRARHPGHSIAGLRKMICRRLLVFGRGFGNHRRLVPLFIRTAPGSATREERRHDVHDELLRRQQGRCQLQRDGAGEGRIGSLGALPRLQLDPRAFACTRCRQGR